MCVVYIFCVGCNLKRLFISIFIPAGSGFQFQSNHQGHINIISVLLHSINTCVEILIIFISSLTRNYGNHANQVNVNARPRICKSNITDPYASITKQHIEMIEIEVHE